MPNIENFNRLIDFILDEAEVDFYMFEWVEKAEEEPCGTTACIGGSASLIMLQDRGGSREDILGSIDKGSQWDPSMVNVEEIAAWLGADEALMDRLFFGLTPLSIIDRSRTLAAGVLAQIRDGVITSPIELDLYLKEIRDGETNDD